MTQPTTPPERSPQEIMKMAPHRSALAEPLAATLLRDPEDDPFPSVAPEGPITLALDEDEDEDVFFEDDDDDEDDDFDEFDDDLEEAEEEGGEAADDDDDDL